MDAVKHLDEMDRLSTQTVYLDLAASRNAVAALENKIRYHDAEKRLSEHGYKQAVDETKQKEQALEAKMEEIRTKYEIPDGWQINIDSGTIVPPGQ